MLKIFTILGKIRDSALKKGTVLRYIASDVKKTEGTIPVGECTSREFQQAGSGEGKEVVAAEPAGLCGSTAPASKPKECHAERNVKASGPVYDPACDLGDTRHEEYRMKPRFTKVDPDKIKPCEEPTAVEPPDCAYEQPSFFSRLSKGLMTVTLLGVTLGAAQYLLGEAFQTVEEEVKEPEPEPEPAPDCPKTE